VEKEGDAWHGVGMGRRSVQTPVRRENLAGFLQLAVLLREDGIKTILDQWHAVPGDQLPQFMEEEIRSDDFILMILIYQTSSHLIRKRNFNS
jgi:hypothetical protein